MTTVSKSVKVNQHAKVLYRPFRLVQQLSSIRLDTHTHTHTHVGPTTPSGSLNYYYYYYYYLLQYYGRYTRRPIIAGTPQLRTGGF